MYYLKQGLLLAAPTGRNPKMYLHRASPDFLMPALRSK